MSGTNHESPKRRRADRRLNCQHITLNQFGECDDVDPSDHTKSKSKSHSNVEFKCHIVNSGSNVSFLPFPAGHAFFSIGTGSTAKTSKGEVSMFDSFCHDMPGVANYISDFSPMLPGSIRKHVVSITKGPRNGLYDDSRDSPMSLVSGASSQPILVRGGSGSLYRQEPATNTRRTGPGLHQGHASEPYGPTSSSPHRPLTMDSRLASTSQTTAVQLFSEESPVHSTDSPNSLDCSNKLIFDDGVDLDLDDRLASSAEFTADGQSTAVRLLEKTSCTPTGTRRSSRLQDHCAMGNPDCSSLAGNLASRMEMSADNISDTEDDRAGPPLPPCSQSSRTPGGTTRHRGTRLASLDSFPQGTPSRLQFSAAPGRSRFTSGAGAALDPVPSDAAGRIFGGCSISSGEISPVSMNISFDSAASEYRDDDTTRSSAQSPARCFGVGGHSLFRDLIRASSDGRSDDDNTDGGGDVRSSCGNQVAKPANRQHRDPTRNPLFGSSSDSDGTFYPGSASSPEQSPHSSWLSSIRSDNDSSPSDVSFSPSGAALWGRLSGNSGTNARSSRSKCGISARPPKQRLSPCRVFAGPSSRSRAVRSLPSLSGDSPLRPTHRRVRSSSCSWLAGDSACSTAQQPVTHLGCNSQGVPSTNESTSGLSDSGNASFIVRPKKATQSGKSLRSRSSSFDQVASSSSQLSGGPNQHDDSDRGSTAEFTNSPTRFMEQRHCSRNRPVTVNASDDGGVDNGDALWLGGIKRSRSPRCVSPRYGSAVGLGVQGSLQECHDGNVDNDDVVGISLGMGQEISCPSSTDSTNSRRPLPDQSAFDSSHLNMSAHASPVCPPTPDRVPFWLHESAGFVSESAAGKRGCMCTGDIFKMGCSMPPPVRRLDSLCDTKVLVSSMEHSTSSLDGGEHSPSHSSEDWSASTDSNREAGDPEESIVFHRDFDNEGLMGSGTFAEVFRVSLKADRRQKFAIKKSRRKFRSRKDRENLLNEVRIMQMVGTEPCRHIIQFHRAWQEDGFFYVQIELADRGTLKDLMNSYADQRKRLDDVTILRIIHDVSAGLEHIHSCHVVHLDIKPPNILIGLDGTLKIGDFGIAMQEGGGADEAHEGDTRYLPEELLNSSERHPSADIFSLGLTLYEICLVPELDVLPYGGALWHDLREGRAVHLSSPAEGGRREDLCAAIFACMSPEPGNRPSAADVLHHPCLSGQDYSQSCLALCGATVRAPSPFKFRTNSFCPIGPSAGHCVGTACTPNQEDDDRNLSTPLMGSFFRMPSPPHEMRDAAEAVLSPQSHHISYHNMQHSDTVGEETSGNRAPSGSSENDDTDDMEDGSPLPTKRGDGRRSSHCTAVNHYFTPTSYSRSPRGEGGGYLSAQRAVTPLNCLGGESSAASSELAAARVSSSSTAMQSQQTHQQVMDSSNCGAPAQSRISAKKKPTGGRRTTRSEK